MKFTRLVLAVSVAFAIAQAQAITLTNASQKVGYSIGADMGASLAQLQGGDKNAIDFNALIIGLRDAYEHRDLALTPEEMQNTMQTFATERMQTMQAEAQQKAVANAEAGAKFLAEKTKEEGVKTTASGLEYKVITEGNGAQPGPNDTVSVKYTGQLIDGTVFDSSEKHGGQPITFKVQDVIPGWVEGLQLMKQGGKYTFYIPANLAYGENGAGDEIPPNSALVFDVELVKVESAKKASVTDKVKGAASKAVGHAADTVNGAAKEVSDAINQ